MNKKIKIGISILLLIIMISVHVSYAVGNQNEKEFFKVNKEEISPEETLEMTFDISSLEYDKFQILLKSNVNPENIYTENQGNIIIENNENAISIDIDKEKISLNQIKLYYPIPKEMVIGTKIQFTAQITNQETVVNEVTKTITVVEKKVEDEKPSEENTKNPNENNNNQNNNKQNNETTMTNTQKNSPNQEQTNNKNGKISSSSNTNNQRMSSNANIGSSLSNSGTNNENQAIYNGSNNNYLSKLEIDGIELNTPFKKENGTYFIKTDNINNINIVAVAEDSTAKVNIARNNKILISVTAQNGDVRYYRIFVNCEEETDET